MDFDKEEDFNFSGKITIGTAHRKGRKYDTLVKGIPDVFDYERILKHWKKNFKCGGAIKEDKQTKKDYIQLGGDHRDKVQEFLIYMGICEAEQIRKMGRDN